MDETLYASAATAYELAYKFRKGKLPGLDKVFVGYEHHVRRIAPLTIAITSEHALTAASLEWHHVDPFDRLIAAQALIEGATVITSDAAMHEFEPLSTLW
jgi:PIN domain nuclease of toxin-antitoxin system